MKPQPTEIGGARVRYYGTVDEHCRPTGNCCHRVAGRVTGPAANLAICRYEGQQGYYLFYCDAAWQVITDTWHQTLEDAMHQAEFEYEGVSGNWMPASQP
jgi:hypothetical protein